MRWVVPTIMARTTTILLRHLFAEGGVVVGGQTNTSLPPTGPIAGGITGLRATNGQFGFTSTILHLTIARKFPSSSWIATREAMSPKDDLRERTTLKKKPPSEGSHTSIIADFCAGSGARQGRDRRQSLFSLRA